MSTWIIEPHHSVIFRDGRPFGPNPGARASSLHFPFPSTTTGGARTRAGQDAAGRFVAEPSDVLQIRVRGPLLVELAADGNVRRCLAPAPGDALLLESRGGNPKQAALKRLFPLKVPTGATTDLANDLQPVGLPQVDLRKPHKQRPAFWFWEQIETWLTEPQSSRSMTLQELGHDGPEREYRMHVSISDQGTAEEGALFQTQGLEFTHTSGNEPSLRAAPLALALSVDDERIDPGVAPLGGERRLVQWTTATKWSLPTCPPKVREKILSTRTCRVLLLTPAHFRTGYRPEWLLSAGTGILATLAAVTVGRPQVISGWDFTLYRGPDRPRGGPKPTRRLAPAGAVYFLRLPEDVDETGINQWIDNVWMQNVSDEPQDRLDGFGLAALGTWDGTLRELDVEKEEDSS